MSDGRHSPRTVTARRMQSRLIIQADRFYALSFLAATTGLGRAELCGLHWSAIDFKAATLAVEETRVVVKRAGRGQRRQVRQRAAAALARSGNRGGAARVPRPRPSRRAARARLGRIHPQRLPHALPGIDRDAAHTIAGLILKEKTTRTRSVGNAVGKGAQKRPPGESPEGHFCS
jgi:integrase